MCVSVCMKFCSHRLFECICVFVCLCVYEALCVFVYICLFLCMCEFVCICVYLCVDELVMIVFVNAWVYGCMQLCV